MIAPQTTTINSAPDESLISLKGKAEFAEFMVVASGRSNKHVDSVSDKVYRDLKKHKLYCNKPEGKPLLRLDGH